MLNPDIKKEISNAIGCLRKGGMILFPSSTGWNAGCDLQNTRLIGQIIDSEWGEFPAILLNDAGKLQRYLKEIPESMYQLIEYSERPLYLMLDAADHLPEGVDPSNIAFTFPHDEFVQSLSGGFGKPLFITSLRNHEQPEKSDTMFNSPLYVVNLRASSKHTTDHIVVARFSAGGSFKIIKK